LFVSAIPSKSVVAFAATAVLSLLEKSLIIRASSKQSKKAKSVICSKTYLKETANSDVI
jgi:hypothetical protein